jgi:hypothetical protein
MTTDTEQGSREKEAARLGRAAAAKAIEQDRAERRGYTITKFERHEDGYYHARVTVDGKPIYMHRRYGSWLCPGTVNGRAILKEVEPLLIGTSVDGYAKEIKESLQSKVHATEKAARLAAARANGEQENPSAEQDDADADADTGPDDGSERDGA